MIVKSGKYVDYFNEIPTSHKLGYPADRIAPDINSPSLMFAYEQILFCLGDHGTIVHMIGSDDITEKGINSYFG